MTLRHCFPSWSKLVVASVVALAVVVGWSGEGWGELVSPRTSVDLLLCPNKNPADCEEETTPNSGFLSDSFSYQSFKPGNLLVTSQYSGFVQGYAFYGTLGVITTLELVDYRANSYHIDSDDFVFAADATASFIDIMTVTTRSGAQRPGFFNVTFDTHGTIDDNITIPNNGIFALLSSVTFSGSFLSDACFDLLPNGDFLLMCSFPITLNKPFIFAVALETGIVLDGDNTFSDPYDYSGMANFFNTATLTNVLVTDEFDVPISGITLNAESLTSYPLSTLNSVPEPGSLVLLATGLVGLLGYGWRKRSRNS